MKMSADNAMSLEKARAIVATVVMAKKKWGRHASPPVTEDEMMSALVVLADNGNFDATPADEVTKLRRQLAACQNREQARKAKAGPSYVERLIEADIAAANDPGNENDSPGGEQLQLPLESKT